MSRVRCAIYTRKSSEEGLNQEFNSLDAQYDACKAYIASQRHEGWTLTRERYDDGGISGGTMERPALKALLADVTAGKVNVIVIYKIDRLTRSLADFARIVEKLEAAGASFVSVTQSFNTKTSMGRLMLHVLLSFAQFEREVGAERVRDKIAASKAKGLWMGGTVPLGYDALDRKLVINPEEARTVRALFAKFVELKSVSATVRWAQDQDLRTKVRQRRGMMVGGTPFHYGALRCALGNRTYVGEVEHKGRTFAGQHAPIVDRALFDGAQAVLADLSSTATRHPKLVSASLLQGLIVDCHGRTMGPVHTSRSGQRFRYYVTHRKTIRAGDPPPYRLAASELEMHCGTLLIEHLAAQVTSVEGKGEIAKLGDTLRSGSPAEKRELIKSYVRKVVVSDARLTIELLDGVTLDRSITRIRHGNDARLIVGAVTEAEAPASEGQVTELLRDAYRAQVLALANPRLSLAKLAAKFGRSTERFKRLLRLSYLSPTIVHSILDGRKPSHMTNRYLQNLDGIPLSWDAQEHKLLG